MRSSEKESRKARLSLCARDGSFYKDLGGSGGESLENPSLYNPAFEVPGHENIIYRCHPAGHRLGPEFRRRGKVVQYQLDRKELKYTYSASYQPVARLKSGNILETTTVDCFGDAINKPGDT